MTDGIDLQALAREIAVRMDPSALLDAEDVGAMLKYEPRYITNELQHSPDFPKPVQFTLRGGRKTHPRWLRSDIVAMIEKQTTGSGKAGRPRHKIDA